jgi:ADP-ribose pyrophosphatase YjhB (NUDIX family)
MFKSNNSSRQPNKYMTENSRRTYMNPSAAKNNHRPRTSRRPIRREVSAGGVVARQEKGEWLVALLKTTHKRGEVWVLPKGHIEPDSGETAAHAARREVQEEAGIQDLSVKDQLGVTRFSFQAEEALVQKTVHYFLMTTQQTQLTPQKEEDLIDATWQPFAKAVQMLAYDTDQDMVLRAQQRLTGKTPPEHPHAGAGSKKLRIHT